MGKSGLSVNISQFLRYLGELTLEQLCCLQRIVSTMPLPNTDWLGHAAKKAPSKGSHLYSQARSSEESLHCGFSRCHIRRCCVWVLGIRSVHLSGLV